MKFAWNLLKENCWQDSKEGRALAAGPSRGAFELRLFCDKKPTAVVKPAYDKGKQQY